MRDPPWKDPPMRDSHGGSKAGNPHNLRAQAVTRIANPGLHLGEFSSIVCHAKLKDISVYMWTYIYIYIYICIYAEGDRGRWRGTYIERKKQFDALAADLCIISTISLRLSSTRLSLASYLFFL